MQKEEVTFVYFFIKYFIKAINRPNGKSMNPLLIATFIIIIGFSLLNLAFTLHEYFQRNKSNFYLLQSWFWGTLVLNFLIQSQATGSNQAKAILLWSFSIIPATFLGLSALWVVNKPPRFKPMFTIYGANIFLTLILLQTKVSFFWKSLPLAASIAYPFLVAFYEINILNFSKSTLYQKVLGIVLILNAFSAFNFSINRMEPNAELWGWITAYALYQAVAVILPLVSLEYFSNKKEISLSDEIVQKESHIKDIDKKRAVLLRVLVHDIANPLTFLTLNIEQMKRILSPDKSERVEDCLTRHEHHLSLIGDLINQVREHEAIATGKKVLRMKPLSFTLLKSETLKNFEEQLDDKNLTINFSTIIERGTDENLFVDKSSFLNSVLGNAVSNAIKFSDGSKDIEICLRSTKTYSELTITNYGQSIPDELVDKVFDFNEPTTTIGLSGERGSGFGLPILKDVVNLHGGNVYIGNNNPNAIHPKSTVIVIKIPRRSEQKNTNINSLDDESSKKVS